MSTDEPIIIGDKIKLMQRGKRKNWIADYCHNGQHVRKSLKTRNRKIAMAEATKLAASLYEGTLPEHLKKYPVDEAKKDFLEIVLLNHRAKKTYSQYACHLSRWVTYLKSIKIHYVHQILPSHFDGFRLSLPPDEVGPRTVHNYFRSINALMKWAKRNRRLKENTLEDMRVPKPRPPAKPVPTMKQVNLILKHARKEDLPIFAMAAFTGGRIGDIRTRFKEDLDFTANWIHYRARPGAAPKGGKERKVPIHPRLARILKGMSKPKGKWLFSSGPSQKYPAGDHHINDRHLNERLKEIAQKLGMKAGRVDGFTFHSLRRFFETYCINQGTPQRVVDNWMGHSTDRSMAATYYGLSEEESQKFMLKLRFPIN